MKIIFSSHAEKRINERGINKEKVIDTINLPDYTISRSNNETEAFKKINNRLLKVAYFQGQSYIKVITLYYVD